MKAPKFLGVSIDNGLHFVQHCEDVCRKARSRLWILRCLAGSDWGWKKGLLRSTYTAMVKSVLMYATSAWGPWLSQTQWTKIESVQREAARIITGQYKSTPVESLMEEAGLVEIEKEARGRWAIQWEKSMRQEEDDPRRKMAEVAVAQRLKKVGWRKKAMDTHAQKIEQSVERSPFPKARSPWTSRVEMEVRCSESRGESAEENKAKAEQRIEADEVDVLMFTDGSASEGWSNGEAAFVAMRRQDGKWTIVQRQRAPAGKICSSFQAEMRALQAALQWLHQEKATWKIAKIVSDSQSSLKAVE